MFSIAPFKSLDQSLEDRDIEYNELGIGQIRKPEFIGPLPKMPVRTGLQLDLGMSRRLKSSLASFLTLMLMASTAWGSLGTNGRELGAAERTVKAIIAEAAPGQRTMTPVTFDTMKPTFDQDWVLICERRDYDKVKNDDIVAFKVGDSFYMHRVVAKNPDGTLTTKADANAENDMQPVTADTYLGAVVVAAVKRDNGEALRFNSGDSRTVNSASADTTLNNVQSEVRPLTEETGQNVSTLQQSISADHTDAARQIAEAPPPSTEHTVKENPPVQATPSRSESGTPKVQTPAPTTVKNNAKGSPVIQRSTPVFYRATCEAVYGEAWPEVQKTKADYRANHHDIALFADYGRMDVRVGVGIIPKGSALTSGDGQALQLQTGAAYIPERNMILATDLEEGALAHEAGHALQRDHTLKALAQLGTKETSEIVMGLDFSLWPEVNQLGDRNAWDARMAKYVGCQPEFEVRLMALNRYHFAKNHMLIKDPVGVVTALTAIDAKPSFKDVSAVFAKHGIEMSEADYKAAIKISRVKAVQIHKQGGTGSDVAELSKYMNDAAYLNHDFYMQLLEKVLMEAPAHQ